ncbi:hypothetical protein CI1B_29980 [Bradyrhizobium ivorense]|uniref:Uncharacterized protein n=1 Tax=Bradyrhizobium ivorense TaxID=2511166 RepID=A0A508T4K6_9BRAD|nr:hypothetical protein CI1B_29980 [Bradyrhizobium ivorense]
MLCFFADHGEFRFDALSGLFDETIPVFAQRELPVAFIHVDCDIYSSTRSLFTGLKSQIRPGCVIVFDEYFNYVGFEKHERFSFRRIHP